MNKHGTVVFALAGCIGFGTACSEPPAPPANSEISQISARTAATMKSQWIVKPTPNATMARIARMTSRSISRIHLREKCRI